jgi:hypothetical protein
MIDPGTGGSPSSRRIRSLVLSVVGAVSLLVTSCGTQNAGSTTSSEPLSHSEWCAEYEELSANPEFDEPIEWLEQVEAGHEVGKLERLADLAPVEIRDDLRRVWRIPAGQRLQAPSDDWFESSMRLMERPMAWISDNCEPGLGPSDEAEFDTPTGAWEEVRSGTVRDARWTLYRTEASRDGVCVSFESNPPYTDLAARARLALGLADNIPVPTELPPQPDLPGYPPLDYQGKRPSCGPKPDLFEQSDPVVFLVQDEHETNRYNVLVGLVMPGNAAVTVTFREGSEVAVPAIRDTFVLTYDAHLHIAKVVPDAGDRAKIVCEQVEGLDAIPGPRFLSLACHGQYDRPAG